MANLKAFPEDFIVEEIPAKKPLTGGPFGYFMLTKRNLASMDAIGQVALACGVREKDVGIAGTKDKAALTVQQVSIKSTLARDMSLGDALKLRYLGHGPSPLSLGELRGNRFSIVLRDVAGHEALLLRDNARLLASLGGMLPNYFDEQRFSHNNVEVGMALLKKRYLEAVELLGSQNVGKRLSEYLAKYPRDYVGALRQLPDRQLRLYVHAVQSHLFNELIASELERQGITVSHVPYSRGEFHFPLSAAKDRLLPIAGFSADDEGELEDTIDSLLASHAIARSDFINRSIPALAVEGSVRSMLMRVDGFDLSLDEDAHHPGAQKATIAFALQPGSYATIVIKFLLAAHDAEHG